MKGTIYDRTGRNYELRLKTFKGQRSLEGGFKIKLDRDPGGRWQGTSYDGHNKLFSSGLTGSKAKAIDFIIDETNQRKKMRLEKDDFTIESQVIQIENYGRKIL